MARILFILARNCFPRQITVLESEEKGMIVLEILKEGRIGGVELISLHVI